MKLLGLAFLAAALAVAAAVESEGEECPAGCSCAEEGIGPFAAACSTLNVAQRFGFQISRLTIENARNLVLDADTMATVGVQDISTLIITNCTFKKLDPRAFDKLQHLRLLHLEGNSGLDLHHDMFNTTDLRQFVLRNNKQKFDRDVDYLFDIPGLLELEVSGAELTQLPKAAFSKMPLLQYISLSSNKIKSLGKEFLNLTDLQDVDLSNNLIGVIPQQVFEKNKLTTLKLHNNPIATLEGISMPNLTDIDLSFCKFSRIDKKTFGGLTGLRTLNLSSNAVRELAGDSFANMTQLLHLDLSRNALTNNIAEDLFRHLESLQVLSFAHNPTIQVFPKTLFHKQNSLYMLDLSFCGLQEMDKNLFDELENLNTLKLSGNMIERLRSGVLKETIVHLDLSHNNIHLIEELAFPAASRIRHLKLAGNDLYDVSTSQLMDLNNLEVLDISSCNLNYFWKNEGPKLENVEVLSIAHNFIQSVSPEQLALTPNLKHLDISDNKLVCNDTLKSAFKWLSDKEIISSSSSVVRSQSMRSSEPLTENTVDWYEMELTLCGDRHREVEDPLANKGKEKDEENYEEEEDDIEEDEDDDEDEDDIDDDHMMDNTVDGIDTIVQRKVVRGESDDGYLLPIVIVLVSAIAILFALTILAAFVLRWSRQRNSYGAQMIKTLNTPRRREGSSIYEPLDEDPNHPTTPMMTTRHANQIRYNFPETSGGKQFGYITYLSKDYRDSTVIPESV